MRLIKLHNLVLQDIGENLLILVPMDVLHARMVVLPVLLLLIVWVAMLV